MATNSLLIKSVGQWEGESTLHLSWLEDESKRIQPGPSGMHVEVDAHQAFATITYWWTYEGKRQEGVMVIAGGAKSKKVSIGWTDSWHSTSDVMHFKGTWEDDRVEALGEYSVGDSPPWGWRIVLEREGENLIMRMDNIEPGGKPEWAVKATYHKA